MRPPSTLRSTALACLVLFGAGCAGTGPFVWAREVPPTALAAATPGPAEDQVLHPGDLISVRVFNQEALTTHARIRADGRIAVPMLGEIGGAGKRPRELAKELEKGYVAFYVSPNVTITVEDVAVPLVYVVGEAMRTGLQKLEGSATMAAAVALAGGPTDFADRSRIFLLRQGLPTRVRFTYEQIVRNEGGAATFPLHHGDVIVFE